MRKPVPPVGTTLIVPKQCFRKLGSALLAVRIYRDSQGSWRVSPPESNNGLIVFTDWTEIPAMGCEAQCAVKITRYTNRVAFAEAYLC